MKYVAIDLGSSAIRAMAADVQENGAIRVLGVESLPADDIKYGVVEQSSGASFKLHQAINLLRNSAKMPEIDVVSVSVGAKTIKNVNVTVNKNFGSAKIVTPQMLDDLLTECGKKGERPDVVIFDIFPLSYHLDGKRQDEPEGQTATQIVANYNVLYGNVNVQRKLNDCIDRTGKIVEYRTVSIEALSAVVTEENERENGCILINFGALTTSLGIYFDGVLQFMQVIPLGGQNITKDIQELGISEASAERLKRLKGCALEYLVEDPINIQVPSSTPGNAPVVVSTQFLATIIEARLDEIMQLIFDSIEKYRDKIGTGIIITGNASRLNNLEDYLNDRTGFDVRVGNHNDWLAPGTNEEYTDISISQLVGTIALVNEYRKEHPLQPKNPPKIQRGKGIKNLLTDRFMIYFDDENPLNDKNTSAKADNK